MRASVRFAPVKSASFRFELKIPAFRRLAFLKLASWAFTLIRADSCKSVSSNRVFTRSPLRITVLCMAVPWRRDLKRLGLTNKLCERSAEDKFVFRNIAPKVVKPLSTIPTRFAPDRSCFVWIASRAASSDVG